MLRLQDLTLGYDRHPAVHHLDWEVPAGSLVALLGPNGGGKSTLLKGIVGELRPLGGRIELSGVARRRIAYLPQQGQLDRALSDHGRGPGGAGALASDRSLRRVRRRRASGCRRGALAAVGLTGSPGAPCARCPAVSSSARSSPACWSRTPP